MSYSNVKEINVTASGDGGDGRDFENWNYGRNPISSRVSQSSPRDSSGSPSQLPHHSASPSSPNGYGELRKAKVSKRKAWYERRTTVGLGLVVGFFFLMNWWMLFRIQEPGRARGDIKIKSLKANGTTVFIRVGLDLSSCLFLPSLLTLLWVYLLWINFYEDSRCMIVVLGHLLC